MNATNTLPVETVVSRLSNYGVEAEIRSNKELVVTGFSGRRSSWNDAVEFLNAQRFEPQGEAEPGEGVWGRYY